MGLWRTIKGWVQPAEILPARQAPGWRVLHHLGLRGQFYIWSQRTDEDLERIWTDCPRADWLVELAVLSGVDRRAVAEAITDCVEQLPESSSRRAVSEAARRWVARELTVAQLLEPLVKAGRLEVYFTHLNHSNLALDPAGTAARTIRDRGFNIAAEGQEIPL